MAVDLELLQGHSIVPAGREEQHVPVVVSHPEVEPEQKLGDKLEDKLEREQEGSKQGEVAQYYHMKRMEEAAREGLGE
jgi:hypothetical protein